MKETESFSKRGDKSGMKNKIDTIKKYFNQEKKEILKAFTVLLIVSVAYIAYLYLVGIPMTKAKNYFNLGYLNYQEQDFQKAKTALNTSLEIFYTQEAYDLLQKIQGEL
jgi:hypothetical protein